MLLQERPHLLLTGCPVGELLIQSLPVATYSQWPFDWGVGAIRLLACFWSQTCCCLRVVHARGNCKQYQQKRSQPPASLSCRSKASCVEADSLDLWIQDGIHPLWSSAACLPQSTFAHQSFLAHWCSPWGGVFGFWKLKHRGWPFMSRWTLGKAFLEVASRSDVREPRGIPTLMP